MPAFAIKSGSMLFPKIVEFTLAEGEREQEGFRRNFLKYYKENTAIQMFRVLENANGSYTLRPVIVDATTVRTRQVVEDANFILGE